MKILRICSFLAWLAVVSGGTYYLYRYESTPFNRTTASTPAKFPSKSVIWLDKQQPTLIFFAHPHCPCTRASLRELARMMTQIQGRASVYVLFVQPEGVSDEWTKTDSYQQASAIPGVKVLIDKEGKQAILFGSQTSGTVLLYGPDGHLRFGGGITVARGMEGDSTGKNSILNLILKDTAEISETFVYGCSLIDPEKEPRENNHDESSP